MLNDVKRALLKEYRTQMKNGFNMMVIDNCSGFIFFKENGNITVPNDARQVLNRIVASYNAREVKQSKKDHRKPFLLPHFSLHILRHTFCTRLCENGVNIKVIQEIMGHSDISVTMNVYSEATLKKKKEAFSELEGKMQVNCG